MSRERYIQLSDFKTREVSGKTHATADTKQLIKHGSNAVPAFWLKLEGDVYVPEGGAGADTIDIRSRRTSEPFRVLLFF